MGFRYAIAVLLSSVLGATALAQPATQAPSPPAAEAPSPPATQAPSPPAAEAPAQPAPAAEAPARPAPAAEAPAQPTAARGAPAEPQAGELAQQLQNPVADLASIPLQTNVDMGLGDADQNRVIMNFQPVIPVHPSERLLVVTRTIVPIVTLPAAAPGEDRVNGVGDTVVSLFVSPAGQEGFLWGLGPAQSLPTATHEPLGTGKYALGPTGVALVVAGPWTVGVLANHLWSITGAKARDDVSATFVQPFATYTLQSGVTFGLQSESTYDWMAPEGARWTAPVQASIGQLVRLGPLPVNLVLGGRYFVDSPPAGPKWGLRLQLVAVLPAK